VAEPEFEFEISDFSFQFRSPQAVLSWRRPHFFMEGMIMFATITIDEKSLLCGVLAAAVWGLLLWLSTWKHPRQATAVSDQATGTEVESADPADFSKKGNHPQDET
jgi:hypothetical protein